MKTYRCRDCGHTFSPERPTNRCPSCGSIYVLPTDLRIETPPHRRKIKLGERLLALLLGAIAGSATFLVWMFVILFKAGPMAAKGAAALFAVGVALALPMGIVVGLLGFLLGEARLARFLGIIWGTDRAFNQKIQDALQRIPPLTPGPLIMILSIIIVGSFAYLLRLLR